MVREIIRGKPGNGLSYDLISASFTPNLEERDALERPVPLDQVPAIILAGGSASRMKQNGPKHLIPVTPNLSLIDFSVMTLTQAGVKKVTVSCARETVDPIVKHIRDRADQVTYGGINYSVKDFPEGVIPAIRQPFEEFGMQDKPVIVIHGDEILMADLKDMYAKHVIHKHPVTVCVSNNPEAVNKIHVALDNNAQVRSLIRYPEDISLRQARKNGYTHTLTGLWIVSANVTKELVSSPGADEFIYQSCRKGNLFGYVVDGLFLNVNTLREVEQARERLRYFNFKLRG